MNDLRHNKMVPRYFLVCCSALLVVLLSSVVGAKRTGRSSGQDHHHLLQIAKTLSDNTNAQVLLDGSKEFEKRRVVKNGLCRYIRPGIIVVPKSTLDVARIVRIARKYGQEISVRSGGHSYLCQGIKQGGIHIDLRRLKSLKFGPRGPLDNLDPYGPSLWLGPGLQWGEVLERFPRENYTMIHGQCLSVGVGGYLVGGGVNAEGTTQKYGVGSTHVLEYTMVNAEGNIVKVNRFNSTIIDPESGSIVNVLDPYVAPDLFEALKTSGSSFGIVTHFHYRIFHEPEVRPVYIPIYIKNFNDIMNYERMAINNRRFHMPMNIGYFVETEGLPKSFVQLVRKFWNFEK